jgi:hypothetical protein
MSLLLRPLEVDDLGDLEALDAAYAGRHDVAAIVGPASLAFFARSGHAFLALERPTRTVGFALAHAVWDGARPTLRLVRLVGERAPRRALAEAVVKSAYDAAVYALVAEVPTGDAELADLLSGAGWGERPIRRFERVLGSARGAA